MQNFLLYKMQQISKRYAGTKVFKLRRLFGKVLVGVLVHKYCKTKVQKKQLIAKGKILLSE